MHDGMMKYVYYEQVEQEGDFAAGDTCPYCKTRNLVMLDDNVLRCPSATCLRRRIFSANYKITVKIASIVQHGDICPACNDGHLMGRVGSLICPKCQVMVLAYAAVPYELVETGQKYKVAGDIWPGTVYEKGISVEPSPDTFVVIIDEMEVPNEKI